MRSGDLYHETYTESVTIDMSQFGYATEVEQFIQHATGDEIVEVVITFDEAPEGFVEITTQAGESAYIPAVTGSSGDVLTINGSGNVVATAPVDPSTYLLTDGTRTLTGALRLVSMDTTARDALTPTAGWVIFNTTTTKMEVYDGSTWQACW